MIITGVVLTNGDNGLNYELQNNKLKFDFGNGKVEKGYVKVNSNTHYSIEKGYGLISVDKVNDVIRRKNKPLEGDFCTSDSPFYFIVDLPEGNYVVKVTVGDLDGESNTTIKAESRRLMIHKIITGKGEIKNVCFAVNVRTPQIGEEDSIKLKPRERKYLNWDKRLTLEFSGKRPCICSIEIEKAKNVVQVILAGNSTVTDQENEPYSAWGQMLPSFFNENVVLVNLAESGESLKSFEVSKRLQKLLSMIQQGDYVIIQFGHNDQKPGGNYLEPYTTYKEYLKKYINLVKERNGYPVLVSSMHRRKFDESGKIINTHGDYPSAMKQVAIEENVPFIDLNFMSKILYESLGVEDSKKLFVHYSPNTFPGQKEPLSDDSHHSTYGAYQLAKCVIKGMIDNNLPIIKFLRDKSFYYDPSMPDDFDNWDLIPSPVFDMVKPDGF